MTDQHHVPTPRDVHEPHLRDATPEEVDGITRIVADAVGLDPADVVRRVRALPVLDAPARREEPKPAPRRRGVAVTLHPDAASSIADDPEVFDDATRWAITFGDLRVYDGPTELAAYGRGSWTSVGWTPRPAATTGADA